MVVLELASNTGSSRGRSSKTTTKKSLFEGAGSSKWWFWNWPAARAAAGAGVPKPAKNRFLKAREAQNGGFGTGQQHGQQQGQEFQNHLQKFAFSRCGKLKMVVLELASSTGSSRGRSSKTTKRSLFKGAGSSKCWFWNWPAARAAAGAGVPKPPKNRFLKAREAQNAGFGSGQQHGQQQGQEFQNQQKIAF